MYMSMSIRNQKQFNEVVRRVWGQLFGIMMRRARREQLRSAGGNRSPGRHEYRGVAGRRVRRCS